ncbi:glycosyltransferase [Uliginosibacterium sp. sgz301328]|uniref:glycosyltransferase n=1 Tax=Uliginosibacterium sp. sgz301328 TaxID=3243764 RepID=UPI00359E84A4
MPLSHIHFYSRKRFDVWRDLEKLGPDDIAAGQARFRSGVDVWVVQTYLYVAAALRERGLVVTAGPQVPRDAIIVAHRDDLNRFFGGLHRSFIVGVRADRSPVTVADIEILQNDLEVSAAYQRYIPLWPQPGLLRRDAARAARVQRLAYFGRVDSLPPWMRSDAFLGELAKLEIEFDIRGVAWNDYRDIDVVLAHRIEAPSMLAQKPATKLYNAWLAGVPALLAPEPAYQKLRQSPFDYLEVQGPEDVIAALTRIKNEPGLYAAMRAQCDARAPEFSIERIAQMWLTVLGEAVEHYPAWRAGRASFAAWPDYVRRLMQQKREAADFRQRIDRELAAIDAPAPVRQ